MMDDEARCVTCRRVLPNHAEWCDEPNVQSGGIS